MRYLLLLLVAGQLLGQTATIHGVVKDAETGNPLPEFTVQTTGGTTLTDEQGRYTLARLSPGSLMVTARNPRRDQVTRKVDVSANEYLAVDFTIPANATISGRLLDPDDQPVAGTQIWIVQPARTDGILRHSLMGPQTTDKDGRFSFDYGFLPRRQYYVLADLPISVTAALREPPQVEKREPIKASTYYGNATSLDAAAPIVLRPGEHRLIDIKIRRSPYYCAEGRVEVSGKPANADFWIQEQPLVRTSLIRITASSGPDGGFRVCQLTPGAYRLHAAEPANHVGSVDFTIGNADVGNLLLTIDAAEVHIDLAWDGPPPPDPVETPPGTPGPRIVKQGNNWVTVIPSGTSGGLTIDQQLLALTKLLASVRPISVMLNGLTNESRPGVREQVPFSGSFGSNVSAGDYQVQISILSEPFYVKELSYGGVPCPDHMLHLAPGSSGTLRIVIGQDGATPKFNVTDADGKPVPAAAIILIPHNVTTQAQFDQLIYVHPFARLPINARPPGTYRILAVDRVVDLAEDLEKLWRASFKAKEIELAPKTTMEINLQAISID